MNKKNNKGFSLVELIVVIAIMAVLVGVLAPQYMKYVNNAKISTDITNVDNAVNAINAAVADGSFEKKATEAGETSIAAVDSFDDACKYAGLTGAPASKLGGTFTTFTMDGIQGVKYIEITATNAYQIYPNPNQDAADATAGTKIGVNSTNGLKK